MTQRAIRRRVGDDQRVLKAFRARMAAPSLEKRRHGVRVLTPRQASVFLASIGLTQR